MKKYRIILCCCIIYIAVISILYVIFGFTCPFRILFGISCPGCGMSRAINALLHFKIYEAIRFHPLIFLLPVIFYLLYKTAASSLSYKDNFILIFVVFAFLSDSDGIA